MSTGTIETVDQYTESQAYQPYRAVSKAAVICVVLALLSLLGWLTPTALPLAAVGLLSGLLALGKIRRYPNELTGRTAALIGVVLNSLTLLGGIAFHSYVYATEVPDPDNTERISFNDLQPDPKTPHAALPQRAFELNGKRVFIKGYVLPGDQQYGIKRFILVPDMGTCCFGGNPALTDMIEVTLRDPLRVDFALRKRKLAGIFQVDGQLRPAAGGRGVAYRLDADYVR
jgi:hypothetical protein